MNSAVLNVPNTVTPPTPPDPKWRIAALALSGLVAVLATVVSIESYSLYAGSHSAEAAKPSTQKPQTAASSNSLPVVPAWPTPWATPGTGSSWDRLNVLQQDMDQLFNRTLNQLSAEGPGLGGFGSGSFDLRERNDAYVVRADMPGADKASIKVNVEGRMLTITGERTALVESTSDNAVLRSERHEAQFVRTVQLPGPVKAAEVDAKYDNGVLTLTLPKAEKGNASTPVPVH